MTDITREITQIVEALGLERNPEGGWYRMTFMEPDPTGGRALSTTIYHLLVARSAYNWIRLDANVVWSFYAGSPVEFSLSGDGNTVTKQVLGKDFRAGQQPQLIVPAGHWYRNVCLGGWTLSGWTCTPGFEFSGLEIAKPGWSPG